MNEIEKPIMEESDQGSTEASMVEKEASQPSTGRDAWSEALDAAGSRDESEPEIEGTFTVAGGQVVEESNTRARVLGDEETQALDSAETIENLEVVAVTENGKEIQIVKHPKFSGFLIQFKEGGQLPQELDGTWTSYQQALTAVRVYIGKRNGKE